MQKVIAYVTAYTDEEFLSQVFFLLSNNIRNFFLFETLFSFIKLSLNFLYYYLFMVFYTNGDKDIHLSNTGIRFYSFDD